MKHHPFSTTVTRRAVVATVLTLAFVIALATNVAPWLRGPEAWRWPYAIPGTFVRLWLPAVLLVAYIAVAWWLHSRPPTRQQAVLAVALSMLMTPAIQLALLYMDHPDVRSQLFYRTVSENANGFFNVGAVVIDRRDFISHFAERMLTWYPTHPQRHPPGLPVLFSLARQLFDGLPGLTGRLNEIYRPYQCHNVPLMNLPDGAIASATLQMALPLFMSLVVWPLYRLGREVYDQATAVRAVLLWPLLPGIALWAAYWNAFYALFTVLAFLLFHGGLSRRKLIYLYLSGLALSIALFLNFGNAVIGGLLGIYALIWLAATPSRPRWSWLFAGALLFAIGVATLWILLWLAYGLNFFAIWQKGMGRHLKMNRTGPFWILYQPYDFFVASAGIPILVFWAAQVVVALRETWLRRRPVDVLALTFLVGLLAIDVAGTSRGEVARVWAFLLPLPLLIAVRNTRATKGCLTTRTTNNTNNTNNTQHGSFVVLIALLSLQLFVTNVYVRYIGTDLSDPPSPPPEAASADGATWKVTWEGGIILQDVQVPATAAGGEQIAVHAIWTTSCPIHRPYTIFVHLYDRQGNLVAQRDTMPLDGHWPTTCWQPGKRFADSYHLAVPETPETEIRCETYSVQLGLYWLPSGERLAADTKYPIGSQHTRTVEIGQITVRGTGHD